MRAGILWLRDRELFLVIDFIDLHITAFCRDIKNPDIQAFEAPFCLAAS